jgi:hypothetical protein
MQFGRKNLKRGRGYKRRRCERKGGMRDDKTERKRI